MTRERTIALALLGVAMTAGTLLDRPRAPGSRLVDGYRVIAADLHTHSSLWSDGSLTPWGLVLEAQRQGLDAIAITGHNQVRDSRWGRSFSQLIGGPTVLTGQEILTPDHHIIAVGIEQVIDWRQSAAAQIDDVHQQGGIAIAAHPVDDFWPGFDAAAMQRLDGSEICHPLVAAFEGSQQALEQFAARAPMAAIGSSDFHGLGPIGACRTFVFASDNTPQAILDAIRARRTAVVGLNGKLYGDPAMIALAGSSTLQDAARAPADHWLDWISRIAGALGMVAAALAFGYRNIRSSRVTGS